MSFFLSVGGKAIALAMGLGLLHLSVSSVAGDFYEKDGVALHGVDPVSYFSGTPATQGKAEFSAVHKGSTFLFSSADNRAKFLADPGAYAPQFNGFCAFGAAGGYKAKSDPVAYSLVDGKLYLNYNADVRSKWSKDTTGFINKATAQWAKVEKTTKVYE